MKTTVQNIKPSKEDKLLFPESGITKNDVINYYEKMADYILPHLNNRPLTMQRLPKGISEAGFFQNNASDYFPDWIKTVNIKKVVGYIM